jgi:hypothetical protein
VTGYADTACPTRTINSQRCPQKPQERNTRRLTPPVTLPGGSFLEPGRQGLPHRNCQASQAIRRTSPRGTWEPSWEPSPNDMRPHGASLAFDACRLARYLATTSHIGRQSGSPSHRGDQGLPTCDRARLDCEALALCAPLRNESASPWKPWCSGETGRGQLSWIVFTPVGPGCAAVEIVGRS